VNSSLEDSLRASYRDLVAESGRISPPDHALAVFNSRICGEPGGPAAPLAHADPQTAAQHAGDRHPEAGETGTVCEAIAVLITTLTPPDRKTRAALALAPNSSGCLSSCALHLTRLLDGLTGHSVDRDGAERLIGRAERDLAEASVWIIATRRSARMYRRRGLDRAFADVTATAHMLKAYRSRIIRLFDDSPEAAPSVPARKGDCA
jgi:hypothetical protein